MAFVSAAGVCCARRGSAAAAAAVSERGETRARCSRERRVAAVVTRVSRGSRRCATASEEDGAGGDDRTLRALLRMQESLASGAFERAVKELAAAPDATHISRELALEFLSKSALLLPGTARSDGSKNTSAKEDINSAIIALMYTELSRRGALKGFGCVTVGASTANAASGEATSSTIARPKIVDVLDLELRSGLPVTALAPKRSTRFVWELAGAATVVGLNLVLRELGYGQYTQPAVLGVFLAWLGDQLLLRGLIFESMYRFVNPELQRKVTSHEAGHFLLAYLCGAPVRGYILSSLDAFRAGIPGQAGTIFSDSRLEAEMKQGRLTNSSLERFSVVLMGGIAAEALQYGQAEGGKSDESVLISLLGSNLQPAWSPAAITNQARWAVLEAILILKRQQRSLDALSAAMTARQPLGECIAAIEDNLEPEPEVKAAVRPTGVGEASRQEATKALSPSDRAARERELEQQLEDVKSRLQALERGAEGSS